jgi:hypothetical protein
MSEVIRVLLWVIDHAPRSSIKRIRDRLDLVRSAVNDLSKVVRDVEASNR